jgi:methyl halide transferase
MTISEEQLELEKQSTTPLPVNDIRGSAADEDRLQRLEKWNSLWKENVIPWDLGSPTPALVSELEQYYSDLPMPSKIDEETYTIRVLVPGCGSGYDLVTLAYHIDQLIKQHNNKQESSSSNGVRYQAIVVGFELSNLQLDHAKVVIDGLLESKREASGPLLQTKIHLVKGDFFMDSGEEIVYTLGATSVDTKADNTEVCPQQYDLIFDYTFFCAIPPLLRSKWGDRMAQLLTDDGRLVTFMFPLVPSLPEGEKLPGPPFPVTVDEYKLVLEKHNVSIDTGSPHPNSLSVPARAERETICWWTKTK